MLLSSAILTSIILLVLQLFSKCTSASSIRSPSSKRTSLPASSAKSQESKLFPLNRPDIFVSSSPLSIAVSCRDGVVLVALHVSPSESLEPLLLSSVNEKKPEIIEPEIGNTEEGASLSDLPMDTRGPLRIETLDLFGSALVCPGWRADGMLLAEKARDIATSEIQRYGADIRTSEDSNRRCKSINYDLLNYGLFLARGLSSFMASCASSSGTRSLSSVALLATPLPPPPVTRYENSVQHSQEVGGCLWLVDTTGAHPCRAHAIGLGSNEINERLMTEEFHDLSIEESASLILDIINEELNSDATSSDDAESEADTKNPASRLPVGTKVEIAAVDSSRLKMRRLRQPFLLQR